MVLKNILLAILLLSVFSCKKDDDLSNEQYMSLLKDKMDCMNMPRPVGSYNYPVLPGMERWASFTTTQQMIDASQVSPKILQKQTTQAVFQAIWEYPFFFEITYRHNHYQQDFETILSNTNAYKEFITRSDAGQCLYSRLKVVNPLYTIYSRGLELFMSQKIFLQQLSIEEKKQIVELSLKNDSIRQVAINYEGDVSREITWLLMGRTLHSSNYQPFMDIVANNTQLNTFLESSKIVVYSKEEYDRFFQIIISNSKKFIN